MQKLNEKALFEFCRDYDICPALLSKGTVYNIFISTMDQTVPVYSGIASDVIGNGKYGRFFTFFKFIDLVVKSAKCAFTDGSGLLQSEMLCLLLERMELSRGFSNLEKKTFKPHTSKATLLPSKGALQQITLAK